MVAAVRSRYRLPEGYVLFVGSVERRKNLRGLLQAYARLLETDVACPLVIVGTRRRGAGEIGRTLQELHLEESVIFTGYVPDADLPAIYTGADLFVFPSLYEGFGLPPLEAMACGTPVVCSNAASLPEVVGDAAIMVDPYDVEGLAEAMLRVLTDADLREHLRRKGLERARQFTWERTARETVAVYREVLG
jgi:glycosyltransferase involved in cell wall biosynthesis